MSPRRIDMPVRDCVDCPFARQVRGIGICCTQTTRADTSVDGDTLPPAWCPLRTATFAVRLEADRG